MNSEEARAAAGRQAGAGWLAGQCAAVCDLVSGLVNSSQSLSSGCLECWLVSGMFGLWP